MKKALIKYASLAVGLMTACSNAWAAERYEVVESVMLDADAQQVWDVVKDFGGIHTWHPAITATEIVDGELPLRGAIRVLTVGDGAGTVKETLTGYSDDDMKISYTINSTDVVPVKDYAASMNVVAVADNLSMVIWAGDFLSAPPEGQPDEMSRDTIATIYRAGLDNLGSALGQ